MNIKPIAYHWTKKKKLNSIIDNGLNASGGIHMNGVYMTTDPYEFFDWDKYDTLLAVSLRGLESDLVIFPEKKWIISLEDIDLDNVYYIGQDFNSVFDLKKSLLDFKKGFMASHRYDWMKNIKCNRIDKFYSSVDRKIKTMRKAA